MSQMQHSQMQQKFADLHRLERDIAALVEQLAPVPARGPLSFRQPPLQPPLQPPAKPPIKGFASLEEIQDKASAAVWRYYNSGEEVLLYDLVQAECPDWSEALRNDVEEAARLRLNDLQDLAEGKRRADVEEWRRNEWSHDSWRSAA